MKANVGNLDRTLRLIAGISIIALGFYFQSWWGLVGLVPLATGTTRRCPAYMPLGMSTCATEKTDS